VFIILYFSSLAAAVWWTVTTISWTVLVFCSLEVKVSTRTIKLITGTCPTEHL
jgi:hypothetical protein